MNEPVHLIFEDNYIVVINKPAGVVVNRADTVKDQTIQDWMELRYKTYFEKLKTSVNDEIGSELRRLYLQRSGMVHRLDKDTSGILILAKTPEVMAQLMDQFKERKVQKTYLALVHGRIDPPTGVMKLPMGRVPRNRKKFGVVVGGKMTETAYQVIETLSVRLPKYQDGFSLLELYPKTGRTHQIRVTLRHLGRPIVSDLMYVGRKRSKQDVQWCPRQFLHAYKVAFNHPITNEWLDFTAELSMDLQQALAWLRGHGISI